MPRPPTMTRDARPILLPAGMRGLLRIAHEARAPSGAICGMAPCGVISSSRGSSGDFGPALFAGPGITTSWRLPLEPSMMVTVWCCRAARVLLLGGRRRGGAPAASPSCRACWRVAAAKRRRHARVAGGGGDNRHRLAAQRIVAESTPRAPPPSRTGQARRPAACGAATAIAQRRFCLVLAERGVQVVRCHGARSSRIIGSLARKRLPLADRMGAKTQRGGR